MITFPVLCLIGLSCQRAGLEAGREQSRQWFLLCSPNDWRLLFRWEVHGSGLALQTRAACDPAVGNLAHCYGFLAVAWCSLALWWSPLGFGGGYIQVPGCVLPVALLLLGSLPPTSSWPARGRLCSHVPPGMACAFCHPRCAWAAKCSQLISEREFLCYFFNTNLVRSNWKLAHFGVLHDNIYIIPTWIFDFYI